MSSSTTTTNTNDTVIVSQLENQAIQASKNQQWAEAIAFNQQIVELDPHNIAAVIRAGVAQAQLSDNKAAKKSFELALELDKSNQLAKKHLQKIKNHQNIALSSLPDDEQFIEEPGKTKTIELHRLTGKEQLEQIGIGQVCELKPKSRFISVEVDKKYIGSLPEDLSSRLTKLMKNGNDYVCYVRSISSTNCSIFIKETHRSKTNEFINSFPVNKTQLSMNEMFMAEENVPMQLEDVPLQMVDTDTDDGSAPDTTSFPTEENDMPPEEPEETPDEPADD